MRRRFPRGWCQLAIDSLLAAHRPQFHDYHHAKFSCNYGNLGWLDAIHGTDAQYQEEIKKARGREGAKEKAG